MFRIAFSVGIEAAKSFGGRIKDRRKLLLEKVLSSAKSGDSGINNLMNRAKLQKFMSFAARNSIRGAWVYAFRASDPEPNQPLEGSDTETNQQTEDSDPEINQLTEGSDPEINLPTEGSDQPSEGVNGITVDWKLVYWVVSQAVAWSLGKDEVTSQVCLHLASVLGAALLGSQPLNAAAVLVARPAFHAVMRMLESYQAVTLIREGLQDIWDKWVALCETSEKISKL